MLVNADVVRVELVWSIRPSMRSPTVLKRYEDGPEEVLILNEV